MDDKKERIKALCYDFEQADKIIQDVKSVTNKEVIPAISQLRYAGWHLARWLILDLEGKDSEKEFSEVIGHSKRAIFDAARHGILFCMEGIKSFRDMYGGEIMPEIITRYSEKMREVEESRKFVISVSEEERDVRADACKKHFDTIRVILQELICCQPELNKLKEQKEASKKRYRQTNNISIIIAVIMAIITIAVAFLK